MTLGVLSAAAGAQLLDLGGGPAPVVDSFTASAELASFLDSQAAEILARAESDFGLVCASELRTLAAALLRSGQELGDSGAVRLIAARKLVRALPEFDAILTEGKLPAPMCRLAAADLSRLAAELPRSQQQLDRALRDALAPLSNELLDARSGDSLPALTPLVLQHPKVDATPFVQLDGLFKRASGFASHAESARRTHDAVARALPVLETPGWFAPPAREVLAQALVQAVNDLASVGPADHGLEQLDRLAALSTAIAHVDGMRDGPLRHAAAERLCTLAIALETDAPRVGRAARALDVVFETSNSNSMESVEPWLPTVVRVAWRAEQGELAAASERLQTAMIELLDRSDPMIEPALLSALRGYRQTREALENIVVLGAALTGQSPVEGQTPRARPQVLRDYRRLSTPLLQAGRDMENPAKIESSRAFIAALADMAKGMQALPGENELRAVASLDPLASDEARQFWTAATGGRDTELLGTIDDSRGVIAEAMAGSDPQTNGAAASEVLHRVRTLLDALIDAREARSAGRDGINASALCELSEHAWEAAVGDLDARLADATARTLAGEAIAEDEFAFERLAALFKAPTPRAGVDVARVVMVQIGTGAPDDRAWPGVNRVSLAVICRDLEELASARLRGELERAERLEQAIAERTLRVLDAAPQ